MNLDAQNLFELASRRLKWLSDRQKVVSENIANADTAGYRAREVEGFEAYMRAAEGREVSPDANILQSSHTWGEDLTGNNVVLEEQMLEATSTAGQYRIAANLYRKAHEMIRAVSG
ncbi:flagellar basal body protein [Cognatishimia sp. SS12]|uniref:flagellar basal body rod protein FlgB n=1 Tax=Cognatishimia sp. SS12 TaxID=2979465 RepID=UPI0023307723|nr:flagellar basal body protein [Cognatishimia sp. SS12]MDC0739472.1 flagellar basal body protein [Cognatishimia sp. SS12]